MGAWRRWRKLTYLTLRSGSIAVATQQRTQNTLLQPSQVMRQPRHTSSSLRDLTARADALAQRKGLADARVSCQTLPCFDTLQTLGSATSAKLHCIALQLPCSRVQVQLYLTADLQGPHWCPAQTPLRASPLRSFWRPACKASLQHTHPEPPAELPVLPTRAHQCRCCLPRAVDNSALLVRNLTHRPSVVSSCHTMSSLLWFRSGPIQVSQGTMLQSPTCRALLDQPDGNSAVLVRSHCTREAVPTGRGS